MRVRAEITRIIGFKLPASPLFGFFVDVLSPGAFAGAGHLSKLTAASALHVSRALAAVFTCFGIRRQNPLLVVALTFLQLLVIPLGPQPASTAFATKLSFVVQLQALTSVPQ